MMLIHKSLALSVVIAGAAWVAPGSAPSSLEATPLLEASEATILEARASLPSSMPVPPPPSPEELREALVEVYWETAATPAIQEAIEEREEAYERATSILPIIPILIP